MLLYLQVYERERGRSVLLHALEVAPKHYVYCCFTAALLLLYCCFYSCFTAALLLLCCCFCCFFVAALLMFLLLLPCCFTAALMLLYCCVTAALLLLYCCFTAALLQVAPKDPDIVAEHAFYLAEREHNVSGEVNQ